MTETFRCPCLDANPLEPGGSLMSLMPLSLSRDGRRVEAQGLLDSGATVNVLPYSLGEQLGLVWQQQRTSIVLSGNLARFAARGVLLTATFGPFAPVRLAFAWTQAENVRLILGQANFFAEFDVCFFRARQEFEVRPKAVE